MEEEIWKEHPIGVMVSSIGRVWLPKNGTHPEHFTFGCNNGKGYKVVGYKGKLYRIHRLVAECFLSNPSNYHDVNHIDEDKSNNNVTNLEWCDRKYNNNFGTRTERSTRKRSRKVLQMTLDGKVVKEWASTKECGRNGYSQGGVAACCKNKFNREGNNVYRGFIWQWA